MRSIFVIRASNFKNNLKYLNYSEIYLQCCPQILDSISYFNDQIKMSLFKN